MEDTRSYGAAASSGSARAPAEDLAPFGERPSRAWDYVFVFAADERGDSTRANVLPRLRAAGFSYSQLEDPAEGRVLVRFGMVDAVLMDKAEACGMELRLLPRYGGGYLEFQKARAGCFVNSRRPPGRYFYTSDVVLLVLKVLDSRESWGAGIDVERLVFKQDMMQAFAVHVDEERDRIVQEGVFVPWYARLGERTLMAMKNYAGSGVALYLAFVSFYGRMLRGIAIASIPVSFIMWWYGDTGVVVQALRCLFGLGIVFWSTYFLEYWKRRNAVLNVKWGLSDMRDESASEVRPQFLGVMKPGFWCGGGFVGLDDLDADAGTGASPHIRTVMTTDDGFHGTAVAVSDVVEDGASAGDDASRRSASGDVELRAASHLDGDDTVVIGGDDDDELFKVEAVRTGVLFHELPWYPASDKTQLRRRVYIGAAITAFFTLLIFWATFMLLYFRTEMIAFVASLSDGKYASLAPLAPGVATGLLISVADAIWREATIFLTRWENHRTTANYDNNIIFKVRLEEIAQFDQWAPNLFRICKCLLTTIFCSCDIRLFFHRGQRFAFQFVSNYSSLFYIAFVKPYTPDDACLVGSDGVTPDCMMELQSQIIGMVLTKATVMQLVEVGIPFLIGRIQLWMQREAQESYDENASESEQLVTQNLSAEDKKHMKESKLPAYVDTSLDFGELVIQYGYFCMFGLSWPLAAVVQFLDLTVETRSDTFKIFAVSQLANARDVDSIGMWLPVMEFLRTMSIITNAALVVFTGDALDAILPDDLDGNPVLAFLVLEHILFLVKWLIAKAINEVPGRTKRLLARQEYIIARWFDHGWKPHFKGQRLD